MATAPTEYSSRIHPKMFAMWLGIASIVMLFAGLTSAYIVRQAQGNWTYFKIPDLFTVSTVVIVASSVVLHAAYIFLKKENFRLHRILLGSALALGVAFLILQYLGWLQLQEIGIRLTGNPSGSFLYVISGTHAVHLLIGVLAMAIYFIRSFFRRDSVADLIDSVNPNRYLSMQLLLVYWHFVDVLWLYLYFFFSYQSA